jgi:hypothetical protein
LSDGRLLIDNGVTADVFHGGFCLEWVADLPKKLPTVSAFLCSPNVPARCLFYAFPNPPKNFRAIFILYVGKNSSKKYTQNSF